MPSGEIRNLDTMLCDLLEHYQPGETGVNGLNGALVVTLPVPYWGEYAYYQAGQQGMSAGEGSAQTLLLVPENERWVLDYLHVQRTGGGDNDITGLQITHPSGYSTDPNSLVDRFINLSTNATLVYWPDPAGRQANVQYYNGGPSILLEPGSIVQVAPGGTGVAGTTFNYRSHTRRMKYTRARLPYLT